MLASIIGGGTTHTCDRSNNEWGCVEANTKQLKWSIPCCDRSDCPDCKGTGQIYPERCPVFYYTQDLKKLRYLYDSYSEKNLLPFPGSPLDQPKVLFDHFSLLSHYIWFIYDQKNKKREENESITEKIMRGKPNG